MFISIKALLPLHVTHGTDYAGQLTVTRLTSRRLRCDEGIEPGSTTLIVCSASTWQQGKINEGANVQIWCPMQDQECP